MKTDVSDEEVATPSQTQTGKKSAATKPAGNQDEIVKKMAAAGTPGAGHRALEVFVGYWDAEVKCWGQPGGKPDVSQGSSKASWILKGHFVEEEFRGEMMGKPFTGRTLMGYDNLKQTFNIAWMSDMQTSLFTCSGKGESDNKIIKLEGKSDCIASGRTDVPMKLTYRVINRDKFIFEMFNDGEKSMEITYTRK